MWLRALSRPFPASHTSRISLNTLNRPFSSLRSSRIPQLLRRLQSNGSRRFKSTAPIPKPADKKFKYPERLLIYHAGTGRIVFIGCLKVTTIVLFIFFTFVAAPVHFKSPDEPNWIAAAVLTCGLIPLLFVSYTTSPFVAFIHLRLPHYARTSPQLLHRFTATLPPTTEIDITTINSIGRQIISKIPINQLYPQKSRFGIANFARKDIINARYGSESVGMNGKSGSVGMNGKNASVGMNTRKGGTGAGTGFKGINEKIVAKAKRTWWMPKPPMEFGVGRERGSGVVREEGIWEEVVKMIEKGSCKIFPTTPIKKPEPVAPRKSKWD